ncbi:hypothetical protein BDP27DRAFT_1346094 [Rhodocollybia butyracea]|uniref:Uncharacterized protein n=1 Tax=Rhodocollybia butyracea TaxID=206335 RepID=A0A9P5P8D8_9AGAR|nr:hypothetical protein BDP27DRAFT_1346094 [Rhodocollybia butyracea]
MSTSDRATTYAPPNSLATTSALPPNPSTLEILALVDSMDAALRTCFEEKINALQHVQDSRSGQLEKDLHDEHQRSVNREGELTSQLERFGAELKSFKASSGPEKTAPPPNSSATTSALPPKSTTPSAPAREAGPSAPDRETVMSTSDRPTI